MQKRAGQISMNAINHHHTYQMSKSAKLLRTRNTEPFQVFQEHISRGQVQVFAVPHSVFFHWGTMCCKFLACGHLVSCDATREPGPSLLCCSCNCIALWLHTALAIHPHKTDACQFGHHKPKRRLAQQRCHVVIVTS